ncbi:MAG: glycogen-binding domain-containing protein [Gemmatimonadaceae bacterium]|nr:glycogen-binding domain-containing protein [Gemmatimonadaceae bacterium]
MPCALSAALASLAGGRALEAQARGEAPIAPSATIGTVTDAATFSVLGVAMLPDGSGNSLAQRNDVWFGATQPIGRLGRVRFSALGNGNFSLRDAVSSHEAMQGTLALRARARFGEQRVWSAISYGHGSLDGTPARLAGLQSPQASGGIDNRGTDTTISRRIDVGRVGRAEAGLITRYAGVELSLGMSLERASRVTTQTITVDEPDMVANLPSSAGRMVSNRTLRTLQRRDLASGMASVGFHTGPTTWLVSVTAPMATWISQDALAPKPQEVPTVASLAVVQPVNGWLSLVGSAASNAATVGGTTLRDDISSRSRGRFSPVVGLGVRISRLPWRDDHAGAPSGILAFEARTLGRVDAASFSAGATTTVTAESAATPTIDVERDTMRVVLLIDAPRAESVELMGDATSWSITQMKRHSNGRWRAELKLAPGTHRIIVRADGGQWMAPPGLPQGSDEYGSPVGIVIVKR